MPNHDIPFYKYLQVRHFLQSSRQSSLWHRDLTQFESLCTSTEPQGHLISVNYSLLFSGHKVKEDKIIQQWEKELTLDLTPTEWEHIFTLMHKGSINVTTQENRYKLFSKWYRTPDKIHHFHPSVPPTCWRCNASRGTLLHIWWECPLIQPFWSEIHQLISQITTYTPDFSPARYLLHHTPGSPGSYKKSLTLHLINAANLCIPAHWRHPAPPTLEEWIRRVDRIANMEQLIAQAKDTPTKFQTTWACWLHYRQPQTRSTSSSSSPPHP